MKKIFIFLLACIACVACGPKKVELTEVQLNAREFLPELQEHLAEVENDLYIFAEQNPEISFNEEEEDYVFAKAELFALLSAKLCAKECKMSDSAVELYDLYIYLQALKVSALEVPLNPQKEKLAEKIISVCKYRRAVSALEDWAGNF